MTPISRLLPAIHASRTDSSTPTASASWRVDQDRQQHADRWQRKDVRPQRPTRQHHAHGERGDQDQAQRAGYAPIAIEQRPIKVPARWPESWSPRSAMRMVLPVGPLWAYIFPLPAVSMLLAILIDAQLALAVGVLLSVLLAWIAGNSLEDWRHRAGRHDGRRLAVWRRSA